MGKSLSSRSRAISLAHRLAKLFGISTWFSKTSMRTARGPDTADAGREADHVRKGRFARSGNEVQSTFGQPVAAVAVLIADHFPFGGHRVGGEVDVLEVSTIPHEAIVVPTERFGWLISASLRCPARCHLPA